MKRNHSLLLILLALLASFAFGQDFKTTDEPVILPEGTHGSFGTKATYILFGDWPQSLKENNVKIDESCSYNINGWTCYKGSDNCFYVKNRAIFNNKDWNKISDLRKKNHNDKYFKIEPIKWAILSDSYCEGSLILAENILEYKRFDNISNDYEKSQIRKYLNDNFLNSAFSKEAIEKINSISISGNNESYIKDKIFLLDINDISNADFGFPESKSYNLQEIVRYPVDYIQSCCGNNKQWWVRTPYDDWTGNRVYYVDNYNGAKSYELAAKKEGIVPALVISGKFIVPKDVIDIKTATYNDNVKIYLFTPDKENISKIVITGQEGEPVKLDFVPDDIVFADINNLENNKEYNLTVRTVNKYGTESIGVTKTVNNINAPLTKNAVLANEDGNEIYVYFGDWPQTEKEYDVEIDFSNPVELCGWNCYKGSDNCYYVKDIDNNYCKLEPIKWQVTDDEYEGGILLKAASILYTDKFGYESNIFKSIIFNDEKYKDFLFPKSIAEKISVSAINVNSKYYNTSKNGIIPEIKFSSKYFPQVKVSNLEVEPGDGKIKLSWKNSCNGKVIITGAGNYRDEINCVKGTAGTKTIESLENNEEYNFELKTVNKYGIESESIKISARPTDFICTSKPVVLPAGTEGTVGNEGTYVLFGDWPQSVKEDNVEIFSSKIIKINGWDCYKGSDGCYYVKAVADPYPEKYKFNNGKKIISGEEYYFKMEPIKWRVLTDNYQGKKLLLAENALEGIKFYNSSKNRTINYSTIYPNNYEYSNVRAYLNGLNGSEYNVEDFSNRGFINKAFSDDAIARISVTTVDNSGESTIDCEQHGNYAYNFVCGNTNDKIFLLSLQEVTNSDYGFDDYYDNDNARKMKTTDYSRSLGLSSCTSRRKKDCTSWLLRSPCVDLYDYKENDTGLVFEDGSASFNCETNSYFDSGLVPALAISF